MGDSLLDGFASLFGPCFDTASPSIASKSIFQLSCLLIQLFDDQVTTYSNF